MTSSMLCQKTGMRSDPCVLVPDNDCGAAHAEMCLLEQTYMSRQVNIGTPMFISVELSSTQTQLTSDVGFPVLPRLQAIDDPQYAGLRDRALPGGSDAAFMAAFARIADREVKCRPKQVRTDPRVPHRPRHDMESLHWVVLWAFIRAAPIPRRDFDQSDYSCFCTATKTLLDHSFGDEVTRSRFRIWPPVAGLDPLLERYALLIEDMAMYVSMPWHLYEPDPAVPRNHAHMALQRMLLSELVKLGGETQDIFFDPTKPRAMQDFWDGIVRREVPISSPDESGDQEFRTVLVGITGGDAPMRPLKRSLLDRDSEAVERDPTRPLKRHLRSTVWANQKSQDVAEEEGDGEHGKTADDSHISTGLPECPEIIAPCSRLAHQACQ